MRILGIDIGTTTISVIMIDGDYAHLKRTDVESDDLKLVAREEGINVAAKDYVAGMTDRFALNIYTDLFVPRRWGHGI